MKVAHLSERAEDDITFRDGLGTRVRGLSDSGEPVQRFTLHEAFTPVERAVQDRVTRLTNLQHVKFGRIRGFEKAPKGGAPVVIMSDVEGRRLSDVLLSAGHGLVTLDTGPALQVTREVLAALTVLHDSRNVTHGSLGPERVILTPHGRVVVVEHVLSQALDKLQLPRHQLWRDWRIATPPAAGPVRFDTRTDLAQMGLLVLALLLGRPLEEDEYPHKLRLLLPQVQNRLSRGTASRIAREVQPWLERLLPIETRNPFTSVKEAQLAFEALVSTPGASLGMTPAKVKAVVTACAALERATSTEVATIAEPPVAVAIADQAVVVAPVVQPLDAPSTESDEGLDIEALLRLAAELDAASDSIPVAVESVRPDISRPAAPAASRFEVLQEEEQSDPTADDVLAVEQAIDLRAPPPPVAESRSVETPVADAGPEILSSLANEREKLHQRFADLLAQAAPESEVPSPDASASLVQNSVRWSFEPAPRSTSVGAWLRDVSEAADTAPAAEAVVEQASAAEVTEPSSQRVARPLDTFVALETADVSLAASAIDTSVADATVDAADDPATSEECIARVVTETTVAETAGARLEQVAAIVGDGAVIATPSAVDEPAAISTDDLAIANDVAPAEVAVVETVDAVRVDDLATGAAPIAVDEAAVFALDDVVVASAADDVVPAALAVVEDIETATGEAAGVDVIAAVHVDDVLPEALAAIEDIAFESAEVLAIETIAAAQIEEVPTIAAPVAVDEPAAFSSEPVVMTADDAVLEALTSAENVEAAPADVMPVETVAAVADDDVAVIAAPIAVNEPAVFASDAGVLTADDVVPEALAAVEDSEIAPTEVPLVDQVAVVEPEVVFVPVAAETIAAERSDSAPATTAPVATAPMVPEATPEPAAARTVVAERGGTSSSARRRRARQRKAKKAVALPPPIPVAAQPPIAVPESVHTVLPEAAPSAAADNASRSFSFVERDVPSWRPPTDLATLRSVPAYRPAVAAPISSPQPVAQEQPAPGNLAAVAPSLVRSPEPARSDFTAPTEVGGRRLTLVELAAQSAAVNVSADDDIAAVTSAATSPAPMVVTSADALGAPTPMIEVKPRSRAVVVLTQTINWRRTVAAAVLLAMVESAAFAAAWWWVHPGAKGTLVVHTSVPGVEVLIDGTPVGQTPFQDDIRPGRHTLTLRRGGLSRDMPVEITLGVVTTQTMSWPSASTGALRVTSAPDGAEVLVGGRVRGRTPLTLDDLRAGRQTLQVRSASGTVSATATVVAGETVSVDVPIFAGWVHVHAPVDLAVSVDGVRVGSSMDGQMLLAPGTYRIDVSGAALGFKSTLSATVEPGKVRHVTVTLPTVPLVAPGEDGAEVFVDGVSRGTLPDAVTVPLGTHEVVIRRADGSERRRTLTVRVGTPVSLD